MYQASQADSCTLMMRAPCLLDLIFTLPRAIANASIILTLHTIVIARPVGSRLREYIASRRFETHLRGLPRTIGSPRAVIPPGPRRMIRVVCRSLLFWGRCTDV